MSHYASPLLRVSFDGPDLRDETLYNLMRVINCPNLPPTIVNDAFPALWPNCHYHPTITSSCRYPSISRCRIQKRSVCCYCTQHASWLSHTRRLRFRRNSNTNIIPTTHSGPCGPRLHPESSQDILTSTHLPFRVAHIHRTYLLCATRG